MYGEVRTEDSFGHLRFTFTTLQSALAQRCLFEVIFISLKPIFLSNRWLTFAVAGWNRPSLCLLLCL